MPRATPATERDRRLLRAPKGAVCWHLTYDGAELVEMLEDKKLVGYRLDVLAESVFSRWPRELSDWQVTLPNGEQVEARRAVVTVAGKPAYLVWELAADETVELRGLLRATNAEVLVLMRGRRLVQRIRKQVGRKEGWREMPPDEFERKLAAAVSAASNRSRGFTQGSIARAIPLSTTAFKRYLHDQGIRWADIKRGRWPSKP